MPIHQEESEANSVRHHVARPLDDRVSPTIFIGNRLQVTRVPQLWTAELSWLLSRRPGSRVS